MAAYLFIFCFYCAQIIGIRSSSANFTIGALFHEDDRSVQMAFTNAIQRQNLYNPETYYTSKILTTSKIDGFEISKVVCNMAESDNGVVAIFGPKSTTSCAMVQSVCANLEIPHIKTNWMPLVNYTSQTILNFYPDPDLLAEALATVVQHLNWKSYTIIYENNAGLVRLQQVLKITGLHDNPVIVKQLELGADHRLLLKEIRNSSISQIILDCETNLIMDILYQAKEVGLLDYFHSYFLTSLDAHTLNYNVLGTKANITTVRIVDPDNIMLQNAVRDWEIGELNRNHHIRISPTTVRTETALMQDAVNLFTTVVNELQVIQKIIPNKLNCDRLTKWKDGFRITTYMKKKVRSEKNSLTGPIQFDDLGRRIDFILQVVEIINGEPEKLATWSPRSPSSLNFIRNESRQMYHVVQNLQSTKVIVSSRIGRPYLMWREPQYPGEILEGNAQFEGYSMDLIDAISKELNFTYEFVLAKDKKYGNYDEKTKSWNGLIKDLLDRRAHLAICDLTITHKRREVVDFSTPFMTLGISILYKKPATEDPNMFAFLDPFHLDIWLYTVTAYLSVSITLYFVFRLSHEDWENPHPCDQNPEELENIWDLKNCFWLTLGSIMAQGCDILPKGLSPRLATSMWWFFSLIMTASYTANLAAFLTVERLGSPISSADDLAKQTKIKYGVIEGGATQAFFRDSNFSTYQRMWTQMESATPSVFEKSNDDGVKRVNSTKNQLYAYLMETSSIEYELERNCELKQIGDRLDSKGYGIAMPINSPYRSAINRVILKMQELGKLDQLKNKWWKAGLNCEDTSSSESSTGFALANLGGVFIVLAMGICLAYLIGIFEFLWNVRKISIREHVNYWEALKVELKFAVNLHVTKKYARPNLVSFPSKMELDVN